MKKYLILGCVAAFVFFVAPTHAATNWNLTGTYTINFTLSGGGDYLHTMNVTSMNLATGDFSGTGQYNADPSYTWNVNGNISGSNLTFHILYTGSNAGYTVDAIGTIASDGSMSGTATGPGQTFDWKTASGNAKHFRKCDCKRNGWRRFWGHKFKNQGQCISFFTKGNEMSWATGNIWFHHPDTTYGDAFVSFNAFDLDGPGSDKGKAYYRDHTGWYKFKVETANVDDDEAAFAGPVYATTHSCCSVGSWIYYKVKDVGTPGSKGDLLWGAVTDENTAKDWVDSLNEPIAGIPVFKGNLVVHD